MRSGGLLIAQGLTGHCSVIASVSRAFILTRHLFITSPHLAPCSEPHRIHHTLIDGQAQHGETRPGQCLLISVCGAARTLASIVHSSVPLTLLWVLLLY